MDGILIITLDANKATHILLFHAVPRHDNFIIKKIDVLSLTEEGLDLSLGFGTSRQDPISLFPDCGATKLG